MDNVTLVIPTYRIQIVGSHFKPTFRPVIQHGYWTYKSFKDEFGPFRRFTQNAPAESRAKGIVYPNLTIYEKVVGLNYSCNLYIACSLPKLLWGQSYSELKDTDFEKVLTTLSKRLSDMGIKIKEDQLANAHVQTLHFAKNIRFKNLNEAKIFLERLSKVSYTGWHDNNVKSYSGDGKAVRFHTSTYEIIFYLKYADLLQKGTRSVDRNKTLQEIQLAKEFKKNKEIPAIVRIEIRYNGTRSIRSHLKASTQIDSPYWKFKEVFSSKVASQVLNHFWQQLISDPFNYYLLCKTDYKDICMRIQENYKESSSKEIDEVIGFFTRLQTQGVKELKEDILSRHSRQTWIRKKKQLAKFAKQFGKSDESLIETVTSALNDNPIYQEHNYVKQLKLL